jgi:hypothetical protein
MKISLGQILSAAQMIGGFVQKVQDAHPNAPGADKHAIVRDLALDALPVIEGITGKDLNNPLILEAVDAVISAEKAALNAKNKLAAVVASVKASSVSGTD